MGGMNYFKPVHCAGCGGYLYDAEANAQIETKQYCADCERSGKYLSTQNGFTKKDNEGECYFCGKIAPLMWFAITWPVGAEDMEVLGCPGGCEYMHKTLEERGFTGETIDFTKPPTPACKICSKPMEWVPDHHEGYWRCRCITSKPKPPDTHPQ
jgi:hypothetical protein